MNARDEANVGNLNPALVAKLETVYAARLARGASGFLVCEGYRNGVTQNADYAKGRNAAGHVVAPREVVTNAKAGQSMHQYGLAVDAVPYLAGEAGDVNWAPNTPQYKEFVADMKAAGLEWGGDPWMGTGDDDHFQMPGLPYTPPAAMQADYANHVALPTIWAKAAAGGYKVVQA